MEDTYTSSSLNNSVSYPREKELDDESDQEESGWTSYFEDFFSTQAQHHNHHQNHSVLDNPSFGDGKSNPIMISRNPVSDAASYVDYWKSSPKYSRKLNFKKTRTKEISYDDSLEDTASSPVNSPKVGGLNMKEMEFNQRTLDDNIEKSMVKGASFDHHFHVQTEGLSRDQMVFQGEIRDHSTNLRKKGMCLVPVSMLANYFG